MSKPFKGIVNIDIRDSTPDWEPDGAPNVLFIMWDDPGFGAMSPSASPIETPRMQKLADGGLSYSQLGTAEQVVESDDEVLTGKCVLGVEFTKDSLNVDRDGASPVTCDYPGDRPWGFTGGTIKQVVVDVAGEPYVDLEKEAMAILSRE